MSKFPSYYDEEKRECRECGCLLPPDPDFVKEHARDSAHIIHKLERENAIKQEPKQEVVMETPRTATEFVVRDVAPTMVGTLAEVETRYKQLQLFIQGQMVEGEDFGTIPGCSKPSLFKSGAEKLLELYGYAVSDIEITSKVEDWEKGFFAYEMKATAVSKRSGQIIGTGIGACNSKEKKYISQDPYTIQNTLLKMAKKRAVVDLALLVTRSSALFTQDVEDMEVNGGHTPLPKTDKPPITSPDDPLTDKQLKCIETIAHKKNLPLQEMLIDTFSKDDVKLLTKGEASKFIDSLMK